MHYSDLVQLYFERSNALQWYWTLYVVIAGGLLAFSSLRQRPDLITALLVSILFGMFAYKNLGAIHDTSEQRYAALNAMKQVSSDGTDQKVAKTLEPTFVAPEWEGVRNFHLLSDVLVIAAVWAMEYRRMRAVQRLTAAGAAG